MLAEKRIFNQKPGTPQGLRYGAYFPLVEFGK
jgi:hypothetical protein